MWPKSYRDYKVDDPLIKQTVESGKGITGCEMHDLNGWGLSFHNHRKRPKQGFFASLFKRKGK